MSDPKKFVGEPTLGQVMRRPRWILALLLALAVAAGFASLAQWQMGSAVLLEQSKVDTEEVTELASLTSEQMPLTDVSAGRMVAVTGDTVAGDSVVIAQRQNFDELGYWVVAHAKEAATGANLAIAVGWSSDEETATRIAQDFQATEDTVFVGRYMPQESVQLPAPKDDQQRLTTLSVGQLINLWQPFEGGVYAGYMVLEGAPDGLSDIQSVPPIPQEKINWLNLFYAIEWVVFGLFAVFFWFRLAKDAWEKEHELKALLQEGKEYN